jgi:hypothetical protein
LSRLDTCFGSLLLPGGVAMMGFAVYLFNADHALDTTGERTQGTVIEMIASRDSRRNVGNSPSLHYRPRVEFRTRDGSRHEFVSRASTNSRIYEEGEEVTVLFDPENPANANIDSFFERFLGPFFVGLLGSIFALAGGWMIMAAQRRRRYIANLRRDGLKITAEVLDCVEDKATESGKLRPFRVHAQAIHPVTGKLTSFISDPVYYASLSDIIPGKTVPVLIDRGRSRTPLCRPRRLAGMAQ